LFQVRERAAADGSRENAPIKTNIVQASTKKKKKILHPELLKEESSLRGVTSKMRSSGLYPENSREGECGGSRAKNLSREDGTRKKWLSAANREEESVKSPKSAKKAEEMERLVNAGYRS